MGSRRTPQPRRRPPRPARSATNGRGRSDAPRTKGGGSGGQRASTPGWHKRHLGLTAAAETSRGKERPMPEGLFIIRAVIGGLLFAHGAQKLFGWYGGFGLGRHRGVFLGGGEPGRPRDGVYPAAYVGRGGVGAFVGGFSPPGAGGAMSKV